jgi:hypothetical protein
MKTKIVILSLLTLFAFIANVNTSAQGFSLGLKAGAGFSYLSNFIDGDGHLKRSTNIMADGGLVGNLSFSKLVSLQFEILYEQKGENYRITFDESSEKVGLYLNYLTLPILVEFSHSFGSIKLFGGLGPYVGYALDGKIVLAEEREKITFGEGNFRRFDVGASADLGVGFKVGRGHLILDLRYNYGFMDIMQPKNKPDGYKSHCNRNFAIYLGYQIPLGKK